MITRSAGSGLGWTSAEEDEMADTVGVTIPFEPDIARVLENPVRRDAAGRVLSGLLKGGHLRDMLGEVVAAAKKEARGNGLTDADIDAELVAWRTELTD
jgi:hypothetical protein